MKSTTELTDREIQENQMIYLQRISNNTNWVKICIIVSIWIIGITGFILLLSNI